MDELVTLLDLIGHILRYYQQQGQTELIKKETGYSPVLLLDDVFSELDSNRQKYLIESMKDIQVFVTATGIEENIKNLLPDGKIYYVDNGKVGIYNR